MTYLAKNRDANLAKTRKIGPQLNAQIGVSTVRTCGVCEGCASYRDALILAAHVAPISERWSHVEIRTARTPAERKRIQNQIEYQRRATGKDLAYKPIAGSGETVHFLSEARIGGRRVSRVPEELAPKLAKLLMRSPKSKRYDLRGSNGWQKYDQIDQTEQRTEEQAHAPMIEPEHQYIGKNEIQVDHVQRELESWGIAVQRVPGTKTLRWPMPTDPAEHRAVLRSIGLLGGLGAIKKGQQAS